MSRRDKLWIVWIAGMVLSLACGPACTDGGVSFEQMLGAHPSTMAAAQTGRVARDFSPVRAGPGSDYPVIWRLYEGSQVAIVGEARGPNGTLWQQIWLWNSHEGWLDAADISFDSYPPPPPPASGGGGGGPCQPSATPRPLGGPQPLAARGTVLEPTALLASLTAATPTVRVPAGEGVTVDAWATDRDGRMRFRVRSNLGTGWAAAGAVALASADPLTRLVDGKPIVAPLHGTGMWFTLDSREHGEEAGIRVASAAAGAGLSHLYVEVATSRGGFFGAGWLDDLLPAARAAGIAVIGSVYVCLDDPATDLALALEVVRYRTPDGLSLDGLTADIEETLVASNVRAFGELLRHYTGDDYLLIATVYPPESSWARYYPWTSLANAWNAVAPMAYWRHMEERPFTPPEVYAYIQRNVAKTRELVGRPDLPVEPLGQLYELGRPKLLGPNPPTAAEVAAAAVAARDAGAAGISFFDWSRATPAHWEALPSLRW
jgi:hypothetical protein